MGYFSNGTEGLDYEKRYCEKCVHYGDPVDGPGCPVWFAHLVHNYDECRKPDSILNILIPRTEDGINQQCAMFIDRGEQG